MTRSLAWIAALSLSLVAVDARAQFGVNWLEYAPDGGRLKNPDGSPATQVIDDTQQKDFAVADVDHDGWPDVAVVRKTPFSFPGKKPNFLLMNEGGVLVDRTAQYASDSDVPGDQGFLTPTDDRDVKFADFDNDGWVDMVTSTQNLTVTADPKSITHPRIYMNKGADPGGAWLGFRYEESRIPLLMAGAVPGTVRFFEVATGDVTGDGFVDLYFSDIDVDENGHSEPAGTDLNDRLLVNDGFGFFTDQTSLRMTSQMTTSFFGLSSRIADVNGDGRNDVVRVVYLTSIDGVTVSYNDANATLPNGVGYFDAYAAKIGTTQPQCVDVGDLNNDGRLDFVSGDCNTDAYRFNTGNDAQGKAQWSSLLNFSYLTGSSDDSFVGRVKIVDLDGDGWNDVFTADADQDLAGCARRGKFFHNLGGAPGSSSIVLREEKQVSGASGWFGAVGVLPTDMKGTFDAAFLDLDQDGDLDMLLGRCLGTKVWMNPRTCQADLGYGGPGDAKLQVCGSALSSGSSAILRIHETAPNAPGVLIASLSSNPIATLGGTIVPIPALLVLSLQTDPTGNLSFPVPGGGGPFSVYAQGVFADPSQTFGYEFTNAVRIDFLP